MEISVLIVNWNRQDYIRTTLEDLRTHLRPAMEILVVDNGSTDGAPDMIAQEFPEVRLIRLPVNLGQCAGLNLGLRSALGNVVISLDNDATLRQGSVDAIRTMFHDRPKMAALHGRIIDYDTREDVWWWGWYGCEQELCSHREFSTPWKIAEGLCALRREAVLSVGGFPEEYFIMEAGRDLAIRLIDVGYEIWYTPDVAFFHKSSAERERTDAFRLHSSRRMYFKLRNELWTVWKYYPLHVVVARTLVKIVSWAVIMAGQRSFTTYLRAMADAFKGIRMIAEKRRPARQETIRTVEYSRVRALQHLKQAMSWYFVLASGNDQSVGEAPSRRVRR